jgi:hypothetical protein
MKTFQAVSFYQGNATFFRINRVDEYLVSFFFLCHCLDRALAILSLTSGYYGLGENG